jgi:hypothetical protein
MHTPHTPLRSLGPDEHARLIEQAKREALRLRREAIAAFWSGLARAVVSAFARWRWPARRLRSSRRTAARPSA